MDRLSYQTILMRVAGLIEAGTNITITGGGTSSNPTVISSNVTGLIEAGTNTTITGDGVAGNPYVINSPPPTIVTGTISSTVVTTAPMITTTYTAIIDPTKSYVTLMFPPTTATGTPADYNPVANIEFPAGSFPTSLRPSGATGSVSMLMSIACSISVPPSFLEDDIIGTTLCYRIRWFCIDTNSASLPMVHYGTF